MDDIIKINNLYKSFGDVKAVNGLNFKVKKGELFAFLGINGALLVPTLFQILYAISLGYLFVIIFYKSKSIIPCICTHILINTLSIFNIDNNLSLYIIPVVLIILSFSYAFYINRTIK